jgi:type IV pilus assembly protein PilM
MAKLDRILAIDVGAAAIKIGEFEYTPEGGMCLTGYTYREYEETLTDKSRSKEISGLLRQTLQEKGYTARKAILGLSGLFSFVRFVKLPPMMQTNRIRQMVEYEVRQNIPFPIEEATWDYQLFSRADSAEIDSVLAMVRNEIVEDIIGAMREDGVDVILTDVSVIACYNAARASFIGEGNCELIIDIGGCNTNLIFVDGPQFFTRSVPVAGYTITQQISKEFGVSLAQAEELKRRHGFVALGGNYADATSEVAAKVSKIVRNVMTRLHTEVVRSINAYRSTQQGRKPVKVYLTGGSSIMLYTDRFFEEKLQMEVSYFNPFQSVILDDATINVAMLQEVAHMFSSVIGLAMRYQASCPVELALIPESKRHQDEFNKRKPFLAASVAVFSLLPLLYWGGENSRVSRIRVFNSGLQQIIDVKKKIMSDIDSALAAAKLANDSINDLNNVLGSRGKWSKVLNELQQTVPPHVWFEHFTPISYDMDAAMNAEAAGGAAGGPGGAPAGGAPAGGSIENKVNGFEFMVYVIDMKPPLSKEKLIGMLIDKLRASPLAAVDEKYPVVKTQEQVPGTQNVWCYKVWFKLKEPAVFKDYIPKTAEGNAAGPGPAAAPNPFK